MTRVLGIDPSLTSTGLALIDTDTGFITTTRVQTKAKGHERVEHILGCISGASHDVDLIGIEGMAYGAKGSAVSAIFGLWGNVSQHLWRHLGPYIVVPPTTLKKYATGKGNANKDLVLASVVRRYTEVTLTGNDEADALVIAAMTARFLGDPIEVGLPLANVEAMDGIQVPDEYKAVLNR